MVLEVWREGGIEWQEGEYGVDGGGVGGEEVNGVDTWLAGVAVRVVEVNGVEVEQGEEVQDGIKDTGREKECIGDWGSWD